jgi:YHS domain-containing protein
MFNNFTNAFAALGLLLLTTSVYAGEDEIYTTFFSNAGAGGYDVVAYFTDGKPMQGDDKFSTTYKNADWYFSSKDHLEKFEANPELYVPQYGGYCAWAVANGDTASGDPLQWTVLNNKLYLNYNADIQAKWTADRDNLIVLGDKNWPGVLN